MCSGVKAAYLKNKKVERHYNKTWFIDRYYRKCLMKSACIIFNPFLALYLETSPNPPKQQKACNGL